MNILPHKKQRNPRDTKESSGEYIADNYYMYDSVEVKVSGKQLCYLQAVDQLIM